MSISSGDQRDSVQDQSSVDRDAGNPRKPFFATPLGLLLVAVVLWVLAGAAAAGAHIALDEMMFRRSAAQLIVTYILYAPSTLLALLGLATAMIASIRWAIYGRDSVGVPLEQTEAAQRELLESINQRMLVSETAKRIAFRHEDLDLLRRTIEGDIRQGDFDAALVLVAELANTYGYREEAERYRDRVDQARQREREAKVSEAIAKLDDILARHDFEEALREANKLQRLYTDSAKVRELPRKVMAAREGYKRDLERQFLEASRREDVEKAMALLKEMDKYLTEQEAEPLRETARGVIGKARNNLGVQFRMAVHDRDWTVAVGRGEQIIREFPNSKMADEVRGMVDVLRERASSQRRAAAGATETQREPVAV